jgi:signal transduction histidine kinase/DNA-binding response OmpR family regulator/HPt (histidine-containing phosphotransfer) domain-containing protein
MNLNKLINKFTLSQSLAIMIFLALSLPIPILISVYAKTAFKTKQEEFSVLSKKKFELSCEIFTESLWNFYPELAKTTIDQLSLDKNFVSVKIKDAHGMVFVSKTMRIVQDKENTLTFSKNLYKKSDNIGSVEMMFQKNGLWTSIKADMFLFGSFIMLQILAVMGVISFLYYIKILKPVKRLVYQAHRLAKKNLDEAFIWRGKDELNIVGRALDKTRVSLNDLFTSLLTQNATLDEQVKKRTKQLEEASKYKSEFLANMSHEIRTPMNAIVGMSHLVSKTNLSDVQSNYIHKIQDASSVLLHIINDILDFSKIEAGKLVLESIPFDLHKELKKSISIFSILAKEKEIEFEANFVHTHRFFKGDPYRIVQIINNFLSNAIKFTKEGAIKLEVSQALSDKKRSKLLFSVEDSGEGIALEKQSKLFQAFSQVDSSTTRKHGGTGLGLYICTQLALMMKGRIFFESEEGKGSKFFLELVLEKVDGEQVQKEGNAEEFVPLNILLFDIDKDSRTLLQEYIRSFGFFVNCVSSLEEARQLLKETTFDLFIIEYDLDSINGIKAYQTLQKEIKRVPHAILISEDDEDGTLKSKALSAGFERFLLKPINPSYLYDDIVGLCQVEKTTSLLEHSKIDFSDKKILLVEDNEINLEVAIYLLKETDAFVSIAKNGLEAVYKVKNEKYDVILMDIQMPVLDGYEATKIIRNELHYEGPIIAMTANVMSHDIEKCLKVGMNEHIGKPLEIEEFYETLLKVLGKELLPNSHCALKENIGALDKVGAIGRLGGNEKLWLQTTCKFYEKYKNLPSSIREMIDKNEQENLQIYMHSLKGLCGTIGANILQGEAYKIEMDIKNGETLKNIEYKNLFQSFDALFSILKIIYEKNFQKSEQKSSKNLDKQEVLHILDDLEQALELSSVSQVKSCIKKLQSYSTILKSENFDRIVKLCEDFDFDSAIEHLDALKKEI